MEGNEATKAKLRETNIKQKKHTTWLQKKRQNNDQTTTNAEHSTHNKEHMTKTT